METKIVDTRGYSCPQPVLMTKKVLDGLSSGRTEVLVDTVTSRENVVRYGEHAGWSASFEESDGGYKVILMK
jgi:tRNA 2-thiouridine synthesizing protein A